MYGWNVEVIVVVHVVETLPVRVGGHMPHEVFVIGWREPVFLENVDDGQFPKSRNQIQAWQRRRHVHLLHHSGIGRIRRAGRRPVEYLPPGPGKPAQTRSHFERPAVHECKRTERPVVGPTRRLRNRSHVIRMTRSGKLKLILAKIGATVRADTAV